MLGLAGEASTPEEALQRWMSDMVKMKLIRNNLEGPLSPPASSVA